MSLYVYTHHNGNPRFWDFGVSYMHEVLVNSLAKLAREILWLGKLIIAVDQNVQNFSRILKYLS